MKKIKLTQNEYALVDDADYEYLNQWKWCYGARNYAYRGIGTETNPRIWMHRLIMNALVDKEVDHKDGNGINNQRSNLRLCTRMQNARNTHKINAQSGFKGVYQNSVSDKWFAKITYNNKKHYLGTFSTKEEAAYAYDEAAKQHHKEFASPNGIKQPFGRGRIVGGGKLSIDDVRRIKIMLKEGVKVKYIVNKFGITQPAVWRIKNGLTHSIK